MGPDLVATMVSAFSRDEGRTCVEAAASGSQVLLEKARRCLAIASRREEKAMSQLDDAAIHRAVARYARFRAERFAELAIWVETEGGRPDL